MKRMILASAVLACSLITFAAGQTARAPKHKPATTAKPAPVQSGNLSLQVALVMKSGDVKPFARQQFLLLRKSVLQIAQEQGLKSEPEYTPFPYTVWSKLDSYERGMTNKTIEQLPEERIKLLEQTIPNYRNFYQTDSVIRIRAEMEKATIAKGQTGFDGKLEFQQIPPGNYFVFGYGKLAVNTLLWDVPVTLKPGATTLVLDQQNAALTHTESDYRK